MFVRDGTRFKIWRKKKDFYLSTIGIVGVNLL